MSNRNNSAVLEARIELSRLYYPLDRTAQRRWAKIFKSGFPALQTKLTELAGEMHYQQTIPADNAILWHSAVTDENECMFCLIPDVMNLDMVHNVFSLIKKYRPFFTYAVVHQRKDGEGVYDIFRLSRFSYLEHCNRVKVAAVKHTDNN